MVPLRLILMLVLTTTISRGQESTIDLKKVRFSGLDFCTTKEKVINAFGHGNKVDTNYECGFFTNDQERGPYYQLTFADFDYIGSDKDKFFLQHVRFDMNGKLKIEYGSKELSGRTTKADFIKIFGSEAREYFEKYPDKNSILIYSKESDDGVIFTFRGGTLSKFEYWTPC